MLDIATRRANAQGITNFETKVCSADDLPFGDATFDSISVRFGYMFFPDVAKATAEFAARAQAGRTCLLVGLDQARGKPVDGDRHAGDRRRRWCWPHPTRTGRTCSGALPRDMSVRCTRPRGCATLPSGTVDVELVTRSPAEYWEMISEHVSLAVAALQQVDEPARERIAKAVIAKVSTYEERRQGTGSGRGRLHRRHEVDPFETADHHPGPRLIARVSIMSPARTSAPVRRGWPATRTLRAWPAPGTPPLESALQIGYRGLVGGLVETLHEIETRGFDPGENIGGAPPFHLGLHPGQEVPRQSNGVWGQGSVGRAGSSRPCSGRLPRRSRSAPRRG